MTEVASYPLPLIFAISVVLMLGILAAAVILLIQGLNRSTSGFIVVSRQPMLDVAASLAGHKE